MEGLEYGWHKVVTNYHYFNPNDNIALCYRGSYVKNDHKKTVFLSDVEITVDIRICPVCYTARKDQIGIEIIKEYQESIGKWTNTKCPECNSNVTYWNAKNSKEHPCSICGKSVVLN